MADLSGRAALVTGGSRGVGRAVCIKLAEAGADVAINYVRNSQAAEQVAAAVRALGRRAETYQADVADLDACEAMASKALDDFGGIDIFVSNAAIGATPLGRPVLTETDPADFRRLMETNAFGAFYLCRLLVPQMRDRERGDVVMISSIQAQRFGATGASYSAAKAALEALAYTLAKEERQHGIRVNVVAPGLVDTDMGAASAQFRSGVTDMRELDARSPFGFVCQPEDVANAVVFLCSEEGRYITNQRITVDGGGF